MSVTPPFPLSGRHVLITGATGHLGRAMALGMAEAGARVLVNSRSMDRCESLARSLKDAGYEAESAVFDVCDPAAVETYFADRGPGPLHCIINNAYAGGAGTISLASPEDYRKSYESSLVAAHTVLKSALPCLRSAVGTVGDASIINIASMYGMVSPDLRVYDHAAGANPPFYGAAKAALIQWTRYAAGEFGAEGIRVNAISPGPFPSRAVQEAHPEFVDRLRAKVPMGRIGEPHEIVGIVQLLASPASTFINGANIPVDGGWTSW